MIDLYLYSVKKGFVLIFCFKSSNVFTALVRKGPIFKDPDSHEIKLENFVDKKQSLYKVV